MAGPGIALIGCGARLRGVVKQVIDRLGDCRFVGVCDPSEKSRRLAEEAVGHALPVFDTPEALCAAEGIDWVMIGSLNCQHAGHAIAALSAGHDVFCEKPLATTLEDCLAIREAWRKSGRRFQMGFVLRYHRMYEQIHAWLEAGRIGQIISLEFNETLSWGHGAFIHGDWRRHRELAGTHLLEKCCHDVDLVNWFVGARARRAASFGGRRFFTPEQAHQAERIGPGPHGEKPFGLWPGHQDPFTDDKSIVDHQVAILEFENQVRASFHTHCCCGLPERRMVLIGTEGAMRGDAVTGRLELGRYHYEPEIETLEATGGDGGHGGADPRMADELARLMQDPGARPRTSVEEGIASAATCFGIDAALEHGGVEDLAPRWAQIDGAPRGAPPGR